MKSGGQGCPTCDWDIDQHDRASDIAVANNYELKVGETQAEKLTMRALKVLGLKEAKWKIKSKVQHSARDLCCAKEKRVGKQVALTAFADFEAEAEGDVLPMKAALKSLIGRLLKKVAPAAEGDIDLGLFAKVKASLNLNAPSLARKACDRRWVVTGGLLVSGTGELELRLSGETSILAPDGKPIKAKVIPIAGGITASGGAQVIGSGLTSPPRYDGKVTLYWFIKSEIEVWNFKDSFVWYADTFDAYADGQLEFLPTD